MTGTSPYDDFPDLFDRFTAVWDGMSGEFSDWVSAALPGRARAGVDLGCGAGRHSVLLAERLDRVLAVDTSARMLEVARCTRDRPGISYRQQGVLETAGSYDVVLSVHALHHVGPPEAVLPHVRSLVAPGGTAILADIVDPGGWPTPEFHQNRAWDSARLVHEATGDVDAAVDVLRLLLHPRWISLARADVPLTRERFHRAYGEVFGGAVFHDGFGPLICSLVWTAPT